MNAFATLDRDVRTASAAALVLLRNALHHDRPEILTRSALESVAPDAWGTPSTRLEHHQTLDVQQFVHDVLSALESGATEPTPSMVTGAGVWTVPRQRTPRAWFTTPHLHAQTLRMGRLEQARWGAAAEWAMAHVPTQTMTPWSWGWLWSMPRRPSLNLVITPRLAQPQPWMDSDGWSPWEALVQPRLWSETAADALLATFGAHHPVFEGQLVAALRVNNQRAQQWWLARHAPHDVAPQMDLWRGERGPQAWGADRIAPIEKGLLTQHLTHDLATAPRRRRL